jgi:hypothetical protein
VLDKAFAPVLRRITARTANSTPYPAPGSCRAAGCVSDLQWHQVDGGSAHTIKDRVFVEASDPTERRFTPKPDP